MGTNAGICHVWCIKYHVPEMKCRAADTGQQQEEYSIQWPRFEAWDEQYKSPARPAKPLVTERSSAGKLRLMLLPNSCRQCQLLWNSWAAAGQVYMWKAARGHESTWHFTSTEVGMWQITRLYSWHDYDTFFFFFWIKQDFRNLIPWRFHYICFLVLAFLIFPADNKWAPSFSVYVFVLQKLMKRTEAATSLLKDLIRKDGIYGFVNSFTLMTMSS